MHDQAPITDRQRVAEAFWDRWALAGNEGVPRTPEGDLDVDAATEAGERDARRVLPFLHPDAVVLELGCGVGRLLRPVAAHVSEAIGLDVSAVMIEEAEHFLEAAPNVRLIKGDGATLEGVESESVDLVFSLLALIHVDKRSAFRYLREIRRVLKPGGRALLQFQNLLAQRGFELFQETVETDFPFEFYTPEELRFLVRGAGLEVQVEHQNGEFLEIVALRGRPDGWLREWRQGFKVDDVKRTGLFSEGGDLERPGKLEFSIVNSSENWRTAELNASLHRRQAGRLQLCHFGDGVLFGAPKGRTKVTVEFSGSELSLSADGKLVSFAPRRAEPMPPAGRLELHVAVIPSGLRWNEETARLFPSCAMAWTLPVGP